MNVAKRPVHIENSRIIAVTEKTLEQLGRITGHREGLCGQNLINFLEGMKNVYFHVIMK